jgi:hypothetical protein
MPKTESFTDLANSVEEPITVSPEELSTNFYWTFGDKEVTSMQTTVRGNPTMKEIEEHFFSVSSAFTAMLGTGGHAKQIGSGSFTTTAAKAQTTADGVNTFYCTEIVVTPVDKDGEDHLKVEFWAKGREYPDLYYNGPVGRFCDLIGEPWVPENFSKSKHWPVNLDVEWVESSRRTKPTEKHPQGKPYHDIVRIKNH